MSEPSAPAPPPSPATPPAAAAPRRRMPLPWQVALGFFAPSVLAIVFLVGVELTNQRGKQVFFGAFTYIVWLVATGLLSRLLWVWSGRKGWGGIRAGLLIFAVVVLILFGGALYAAFRLVSPH